MQVSKVCSPKTKIHRANFAYFYAKVAQKKFCLHAHAQPYKVARSRFCLLAQPYKIALSRFCLLAQNYKVPESRMGNCTDYRFIHVQFRDLICYNNLCKITSCWSHATVIVHMDPLHYYIYVYIYN